MNYRVDGPFVILTAPAPKFGSALAMIFRADGRVPVLPLPRVQCAFQKKSEKMNYRADGPFVILTTDGKATVAERQAVFNAIRSDSKVKDGAYLIIDLRKFAVRLTQSELQDRVRALLLTLATKIGSACAVIVRDTSLRMGLDLQLIAGNMNYQLSVFNDEVSARRWLTRDRTDQKG